MKQNLLAIVAMILLADESLCLVEKDSGLFQLHRYYYDDRDYYRQGSRVGWFTALIISIVAGVLCFLGIMYYFKWRR